MNNLIKIFKTADNSIRKEEGYTLIEVLVALIILFIVLIPMTQLIGFLISDTANVDKINAVMIAEREMELCVINLSYENYQRIESINGKKYQIIKNIEKRDNLVIITIKVRHPINHKQLIQIRTSRLINE